MADNINSWIEELNSDNFVVRTQAAEALGKSGDSRAIDALKAAFRPYDYIPPTEELYIFYVTVAIILAENGVFAPYTQIAESDREPPFLRSRVLAKLTEVGEQRAMRAAVRMLASGDHWESYWAILTLTALKISDESASAALAALAAKEMDQYHRQKMIWALERVGTENALPTLNQIASDVKLDEKTRTSAQEAIRKINERLPPLINDLVRRWFKFS